MEMRIAVRAGEKNFSLHPKSSPGNNGTKKSFHKFARIFLFAKTQVVQERAHTKKKHLKGEARKINFDLCSAI
jgi:hypothetical protein